MSVSPGPKSVIESLPPYLVQCLPKLYHKFYPSHEHLFDDRNIFIPSTFRKYTSIKWHGYNLTASLNSRGKNLYMFAHPLFPFTSTSSSEFNRPERLLKTECFLVHTISLPGSSDSCSHLLACVSWPMIHPDRNYFEILLKFGVTVFMNHN